MIATFVLYVLAFIASLVWDGMTLAGAMKDPDVGIAMSIIFLPIMIPITMLWCILHYKCASRVD